MMKKNILYFLKLRINLSKSFLYNRQAIIYNETLILTVPSFILVVYNRTYHCLKIILLRFNYTLYFVYKL